MALHSYLRLAVLLAVSVSAVVAVPSYTIRSVGPDGYGSTMESMLGNVYGGAAVDLGTGFVLPWINVNGTAQILSVSTDALVTRVNGAGQAIGRFLDGSGGFFYDGVNPVTEFTDMYPVLLSANG